MNRTLRVLDANLNRAREAARVLEDIARFTLDREDLCVTAKSLRHDLAGALAGVEPIRLLAERDTAADVGTRITSAGEYHRESALGLVRANAARLTEALRTLEEVAKTLVDPAVSRGGGPSPTLEAIRYRAYTLEKELILALGSGRRRQWRLCVLVTESLCRRPWLEVARAAIDGGADCLQLREKALDGRELLQRAIQLLEVARPRGAAVIVNDRADVALLAGADGVHLGQSDLPVREARRIVGDLLVGVSTENLDQARGARLDGADYCGLGPMFATATKDKPRLAGPQYVRAFVGDPHLVSLPHLAIGGISSRNVRELASAGCLGVAVSSAVCAATEPAAECAAIIEALRPPD